MAPPYSFEGLTGQQLVRAPGSVNGESFDIKNLTGCSVFLLDYTSEVEVSNCHDCQIFIGPVDGPAIFDSCSGCRIAVACQQFQAKSCHDIEFELYCATQPSLHGSKDVTICSWGATYPGMQDHFVAASLDPHANQWNKVYDASATEDGDANFQLSDAGGKDWDIPDVDAHADQDGGDAENGGNPFSTTPLTNGDGIPDSFLEDETPAPVAAPTPADAAAASAANQAFEDKLRARLAQQAKEESEKKVQLQEKAADFLDKFYQDREAQKAARIAAARNAAEAKANLEPGAEGESEWERALSLIDFNSNHLLGTDLSRFKAVLMTCKKKAPVQKGASS